jgi:hypothetical protein
LHSEQENPWRSTIFNTNGLKSCLFLPSINNYFQFLLFHQSASYYWKILLFFYKILWATLQTSSYILYPVGFDGRDKIIGEERSCGWHCLNGRLFLYTNLLW